jgi:peptidoglycan/xylan/chitin deacetylase (PgdA/CDA1 family)
MSPLRIAPILLLVLSLPLAALAKPAPGIVPPDQGPFGKKIALTFDDGPHATRTAAVLNVLRRHNAPATFFILGKNLALPTACDRVAEIMASGCLVGNHTKTHPNCSKLTAQAFQKEVQACQTALTNLTGQPPKFFRHPYGAANDTTMNVLKNMNLKTVGWHIDTADWWFAGSKTSPMPGMPDAYRNDFVGWAVKQAESKQGGIMLMHDIHNFTASNLDALLTALEQRGYQFVGLDNTAVFPKLNNAAQQ